MRLADSVSVEYQLEKVNARIAAGEEPDIAGTMIETVENATSLAPELVAQVEREAARLRRYQPRHRKRTERSLLRRLASDLILFEDALALAEGINRRQIDVIHRGMENPDAALGTSRTIPDLPGLLGGALTKCLILNSLHARCVLLGREVLALLSVGYTDGAAARTRALYEACVMTALLAARAKANDGYDLTNRYHVWAGVEQDRLQRHPNPEREATRPGAEMDDITRAAKKKWGPGFFDEYGWARGVLGLREKQRVTFVALERLAGYDHRRYLYAGLSGAVHTSALSIIGRADFNRRYPSATRGVADPRRTARIAWSALTLLDEASLFTMVEITSDAAEWDDLLALWPLRRTVHRAIDQLSSHI